MDFEEAYYALEKMKENIYGSKQKQAFEMAVEAFKKLHRMESYREIVELYGYCVKIGINANLEECHDGWAIRFPDGSDFIQHHSSYGVGHGCVEPAVNGCRKNYAAMTLKHAKQLVKRRKDYLNIPRK